METIITALIIIVLVILLRRKRRGRKSARTSYATIAGIRGELRVSKILRRLPKEDFVPLSDIMIRKQDGGTSQIDHVVLSEYGIFVIETKNYKGWIFGNEAAEQWMQVIFESKHPFINPVKQNWGHVRALKGLLSSRFPDIKYFPIVVFAGSATLKEIEASMPVIYEDELRKTIREHCGEGCKKCLSLELLTQVKEAIEAASITEKAERKKHNQRIRERLIEEELKKQNLTCPRCDGDLVLRQGKYGNFYACKSYPKCKFTMKS